MDKNVRWTRTRVRRYVAETVATIRRTRVRHVQFLAPRDGYDCPACLALDGPLYDIDALPAVPPPLCSCRPHGCRLYVVSVRA